MPGSDDLVTLTFEEPMPRELLGGAPVIRIRTPAGDEAWLVSGRAELRKLLVDRRLGRSHPDPDNAPRYLDDPRLDNWRGVDFDTEHAVHAALRSAVTPYFSARNMKTIAPRVARTVDAAVARLASQPRPADIQSQFSLPLTAQVIGELLGVPDEDRDRFPALAYQVYDEGGVEHGLLDYLCGLAARKRAEPRFDVLSGLAADGRPDDECAWLGFFLLTAGLNSTSKHTTLGISRLAGDPALRDRLAAEPALMDSAVEEFLRIATPDSFKFPRYAREDIELGEVTIRVGELVLLNVPMGNFDERVFADPYELDITRSPNLHISFSHGLWHCLGAPLATMQLTLTFAAVLAALPTLRLAKPLEDMARKPYCPEELAELLVTW